MRGPTAGIGVALAGVAVATFITAGVVTSGDDVVPQMGRNAGDVPVVLEALDVAPEDFTVPYRVDLFGPRWADVDGNGCDTRNDILRRDLSSVVLDADGCRVLSGTLVDPYTGQRVEFRRGERTSQEVPIDHVVARAEAWRSGAREWTAAERTEFANDPDNLLATTLAVNSSKGDRGPGEWLPVDHARACAYVARYLAVKVEYDLAVDPAEHQSLSLTLSSCEGDTP